VLTIFHVPRTRSLRIVWLAEEMTVPYELKMEAIGRPSSELLKANPLGSLPAIVDDDVAMGESVAIMHYLTERHGPTSLAKRPGESRYGDYLQHLVGGESSMAAFLNPVAATPREQRENVTAESAKAAFLRRVAALAPLVARGDCVAGDFTAADISVGYALWMGAALGLDSEYPDAVRIYLDRLLARPGYQAASAR
jgi:glutathione S-transferase